MFQFDQQLFQIGRQFAGKAQLCSRDGVNEAENRGVQRLALELEAGEERPQSRRGASISWITQ